MAAYLEDFYCTLSDLRQERLRAMKQLRIELSHTLQILFGRRNRP